MHMHNLQEDEKLCRPRGQTAVAALTIPSGGGDSGQRGECSVSSETASLEQNSLGVVGRSRFHR